MLRVQGGARGGCKSLNIIPFVTSINSWPLIRESTACDAHTRRIIRVSNEDTDTDLNSFNVILPSRASYGDSPDFKIFKVEKASFTNQAL